MSRNVGDKRAASFLGYCLNTVAQDIRVATAEALKPFGITPRQFGLLLEIEGSLSHNQLSLAESLRVDRAALVAILDDLESKKIVQRRKDPEDRRSNTVLLTEQGLALIRKALPLARAAEDTVMGALTKAEKEVLSSLFCKVLSIPAEQALRAASD